MPRFKKRILEIDTYQSPDGSVDVTSERLKHWADTFSNMKAAKLGIPVAWDHSDDPAKSLPVELSSKKKRSAQNNVGRLESFTVTEDGKAAEIVLDIPSEEDAKKVANNLAEVSPVIFGEWKDGKGNVHSDCITHVDLVNHPVDASQTPFVTACALRMGLDTGNPQTYKLAKPPFLKDDDDEEESDEMPAMDSSEESEEPSEQEPGATVDTSRLGGIIASLAEISIILPEDTGPDTFFDRLETALLTRAAMEEGDMGTENLEQSTEVAALSLETPEAKYINQTHQTQVAQRLSLLLDTGRCTPAELEAKEALVGAVRLSLNAEGEPTPSMLEAWIESREAVPEWTFFDTAKRTQMSTLEALKHPSEITGIETEEDAENAVDEMFGGKK